MTPTEITPRQIANLAYELRFQNQSINLLLDVLESLAAPQLGNEVTMIRDGIWKQQHRLDQILKNLQKAES